jgi:hypothetical protein
LNYSENLHTDGSDLHYSNIIQVHASMGNTFQELPQSHETADNTERYI